MRYPTGLSELIRTVGAWVGAAVLPSCCGGLHGCLRGSHSPPTPSQRPDPLGRRRCADHPLDGQVQARIAADSPEVCPAECRVGGATYRRARSGATTVARCRIEHTDLVGATHTEGMAALTLAGPSGLSRTGTKGPGCRRHGSALGLSCVVGDWNDRRYGGVRSGTSQSARWSVAGIRARHCSWAFAW